ncbi:DMT family transporter [Mongoliimonas terrestris]|uniref:DMT family transporter n=1 Tax=Mongoliimonas terrestris TaxID=1709001 RepID=UPI00094959FB|nr:DMT family transporter [Mongoliimonas terrestris]
MTAAVPAAAPAEKPALAPFTLFDFLLYAITVFAWSTSWIALKMQVGVVAPEVSVAWRFMLSAAVMIGWVAVARQRMRFSWTDHARFAVQGALLFSTNFYLFYLGGQVLASGLLSVVFSLASVINLVMAAVVFRQGIVPRVAIGALIGFAGIGLVFWPEIAGTEFDHAAAVGLGFCIAGTVSFCVGNMISSASQSRGLPVLSTNAWGMVYGAGVMVLLALANGRTFQIEWTPAYIGSLFWLSIVSSVIAFASYLTLLGRIGAARAGYATVIFPVFALGISTVFESYQWTPVAMAGLGAVIVGNLIVLSRGRR